MNNLFLTALATIVAISGMTSSPVYAFESDHYADTIVDSNYQFQFENNLLGAPDQNYTDVRTNGASLKLDMGEGEEGLGDLTLYYETQSAQAQLQFEFYNTQGELLYSYGNIVPLQNTWTISYPLATPYRFIRIESKNSGTMRLDAIESANIVSEVNLPESTPEVAEVIDTNPLHGSLIKLTDDWNEATEADEIVYLLDANNVRHIIPNETVFTSWGLSFADITIVGSGTLTGIPLGKNVYVRPGSSLLKIPLSPKVYAVEAGGVLRWIENEALATKLYGADWNKRVVDVPETLFSQYTFGATLAEAIYPPGSFVKTSGGSTWYIGHAEKRYSIGPLTLEALHLSNAFLTTGMSEPELAAIHPYEGRLLYNDSQRWPF